MKVVRQVEIRCLLFAFMRQLPQLCSKQYSNTAQQLQASEFGVPKSFDRCTPRLASLEPRLSASQTFSTPPASLRRHNSASS